MIRQDLLRGKIVECGYSQLGIARLLGITGKTFYAKMKKGVFGSDEISAMAKLLRIDDPRHIFFTELVSQKATSRDEKEA